MFCQAPPGLHTCTTTPEHWVVPGAQDPVQDPDERMYGQVTPLAHCPELLQVWTVVPEHWVEPGVQTPVQLPELQT